MAQQVWQASWLARLLLLRRKRRDWLTSPAARQLLLTKTITGGSTRCGNAAYVHNRGCSGSRAPVWPCALGGKWKGHPQPFTLTLRLGG
jgi:hypothetical protein